eukprot:6414840-Pyramimonas_sp.AAC.1
MSFCRSIGMPEPIRGPWLLWRSDCGFPACAAVPGLGCRPGGSLGGFCGSRGALRCDACGSPRSPRCAPSAWPCPVRAPCAPVSPAKFALLFL